MRKQETFDLDSCDFPTCRELTEEELLCVNGGKKIENSNAAVADAQVGDKLTRNDGTTVTITQGDIDWAKKQVGGSGGEEGTGVSDGQNGSETATEVKVAAGNSSASAGSSSSSGGKSGGSYNGSNTSSTSGSASFSNGAGTSGNGSSSNNSSSQNYTPALTPQQQYEMGRRVLWRKIFLRMKARILLILCRLEMIFH